MRQKLRNSPWGNSWVWFWFCNPIVSLILNLLDLYSSLWERQKKFTVGGWCHICRDRGRLLVFTLCFWLWAGIFSMIAGHYRLILTVILSMGVIGGNSVIISRTTVNQKLLHVIIYPHRFPSEDTLKTNEVSVIFGEDMFVGFFT